VLKLPRLREKQLEGVPHGYSLASGWSARLTDAILQLPERVLLWPWYGRIPIDRPIFVVGPFRSGTTILEKIISDHPSVGYFCYLSNIFYRAPIAGYLFTNLLGSLGVLENETIRPIHNPRVPTTRESPYECEWIWSQSAKSQWDENCLDLTAGADFSDPSFERYLFSLIRRHLWMQRATRFLNKNPVNCLRLAYLRKLFGDARFVFIARNPIDTIMSHYRTSLRIEEAFYAEPETKLILQKRLRMDLLSMRIKTPSCYSETLVLDRVHPLLGIANQWKDLQLAVANSLKHEPGLADQVFQIRYEALIAQPTTILEELWDFLGLDGAQADRITRAYAGSLTAPSEADLGAEERKYLPRIREIVAPAASLFGY